MSNKTYIYGSWFVNMNSDIDSDEKEREENSRSVIVETYIYCLSKFYKKFFISPLEKVLISRMNLVDGKVIKIMSRRINTYTVDSLLSTLIWARGPQADNEKGG
jgi:hypothetical protein